MDSRASKAGAAPKGARGPELTAGALVSWVVRSLYVDEALPRARLLQWMLELLAGVKLGAGELRKFVDAAPGVYIEPRDAPKLGWSAMLFEPPPGFSGRFASEDPPECYEEETLAELQRLFAAGGWPEARDRSHKYYVVASWLQDVSAHLRALSFGRLLCLVRYGTRGCLLGHRAGLLVPFEASEERERELNALSGQPTQVSRDEDYVRTWAELRCCVSMLLEEQADEMLEVAKLKILFRARFHKELSETVFGYQSLSRLFADPELEEDLVIEQVPANRYVLRPLRERRTLSLAQAIGMTPKLEAGEPANGDQL
uniref:HTH OST-type domain-containing protein n=1 Tax=Alexandrium catenella TaxID=2925 RepID=A0A7S1PPT1_ALECA